MHHKKPPLEIAPTILNEMAELTDRGLIPAFSRENLTMEWVYMIATILAAVAYCRFLFRVPEERKEV